MKELVITATNAITAIGHDGRMTSASVRAGITRMYVYDGFLDSDDNPITVAQIRGIQTGNTNAAQRMSDIAELCLNNMLNEYFLNSTQRPSQINLFIGVPSNKRPGQRFEEYFIDPLKTILEKRINKVEIEVIPQGNASMHFAVNEGSKLIERNPSALCIIGGIDSLLMDSTLKWFEQAGRLKSDSDGSHQGMVAGEAVGFIIIEDAAHARRNNRPLLARISGLGLSVEPDTRATNSPSRNSGLTDACHVAMAGLKDKEIRAVFCDLNGEKSRSKEWGMADMRCFKERHKERKLWHPANCYGDIGAASGMLLANTVTQGFVRNWLQSPVLMFCSDDHGACGAMILEKE